MQKKFSFNIAFISLFFFYTFSSAEVYQETLPNGLNVILKEVHKSPIISFQVWYKVGSIDDEAGKTGLAHLVEHMAFKGTKKYPAGKYEEIVRKNGGVNNAFTSQDYTCYFTNISKEKIDAILVLEADRMKGFLLDKKEFETEKKVVMEERRMRSETDPDSVLYEETSSLAFKVHPYRNPVIGWMNDLEKISFVDMVLFYKKFYCSQNSSIVMVGDFDKKVMMKKVKKYFSNLKKNHAPLFNKLIEPIAGGERRVKIKKDAELSSVLVGYRVPNLKDSNSYVLDVFSYMFGSGKSSRLYQSLVRNKKIALEIGADYSIISRDHDIFWISAKAMPDIMPEDLEKNIYEEIENIKKSGILEKELEKAKNQALSDFVFAQDSNFNQGLLLGRYKICADVNFVDKYINMINAVKADDVLRVINKYFNEENRTVGSLIPLNSESKE